MLEDRPISRTAIPVRAAAVRGWLGPLAVAGSALAWSTSYAATKVLLRRVPPLSIGALRFTVAALLLAVLVRRQRDWSAPARRQRVEMGVAGLFGIGLYFTVENTGVNLATASDATLIVASYPVVAFALEFAVHRTRTSAVRLTGLVLAVAGVGLVVAGGAGTASDAGNRLLGDLLLGLGGFVWAGYNVVAQRGRHGSSALTATYYQTLAGAGAFILMTPIEAGQWHRLHASDALLVAYLAGVCSIGGYLCYNYGLRQVSASTAVTILNLIPVFGIVSAVLLAGESVGPVQLLGGAVVIAGVILTLRRDPARPGGSDAEQAHGGH